MADVADKIISANDVRRGTVVVTTNGKSVLKDTTRTEANHAGGSASALEAKLGDRFDDVTYYTA